MRLSHHDEMGALVVDEEEVGDDPFVTSMLKVRSVHERSGLNIELTGKHGNVLVTVIRLGESNEGKAYERIMMGRLQQLAEMLAAKLGKTVSEVQKEQLKTIIADRRMSQLRANRTYDRQLSDALGLPMYDLVHLINSIEAINKKLSRQLTDKEKEAIEKARTKFSDTNHSIQETYVKAVAGVVGLKSEDISELLKPYAGKNR
jgi:hypothetical protein